jgi:ATP-dependent Clp protease adapter protein ClpS
MVTMPKVLVVNDQKTRMAFVVSVLEEIFGQSKDEAQMIALHAELNGDAICGIYRQHAEAQHFVRKATARSRLHGFSTKFFDTSICVLGAHRCVGLWEGDEGRP